MIWRKFMTANMMNTHHPTALMTYGITSLMIAPQKANDTMAKETPFARVARGKTSGGYTQLLLASVQDLEFDKNRRGVWVWMERITCR